MEGFASFVLFLLVLAVVLLVEAAAPGPDHG